MSLRCTLAAILIGLVSSSAMAGSITGEELGNAIAYPSGAPSSNAANYANLAPRPYVLFEAATSNSITLGFYNNTNSLAFFEYRIDGLDTGSNNHPVVAGDKIHAGVSVDNRSPKFVNYVTKTFNNVNDLVEVRLTLGGERDWDFDWTAFRTEPAPVPLPAAVWTGMSLLGAAGASSMWRKLGRRHSRS